LKFLGLLVLALVLVKSASGESPLADAVERGNRAVIRRLLEQHAEVNIRQVDGMTALHWAAYNDDLETAKMLMAAGVDVQATNHYGVTPLSLACQNGNGDLVTRLLTSGADPNAALRGGETPLMTASRTGKPGPVRALLERGARVDAKEKHGQTALMWAADEGHAAVVELLLNAGADFRTALPDAGFTPLLFAAREGRIEVIRTLLKAGADVNEAIEPRKAGGRNPRKGMSPLLFAVENGHFDLAVALLESGADPNDQRSGFTPLHALTWVRKPNRGDDPDGEPSPLGSGNLTGLQFARKLVERGAEVNAQLKHGKGGPGSYTRVGATPFLMASATADVPYMRLLLELGAKATINNADNTTPLMTACGIGVGGSAANEVAGTEPEVLEAAKLLLKLGADVNAVDANGETAMHGAAYKNLPGLIQFLTENGAKVDIWDRTNKHGWTPLMIAQGHRPGNFKPSAETAAMLESVTRAGYQEGASRAPKSSAVP
jgi:ankyrin repeat protein